jgi:hypothetical protein
MNALPTRIAAVSLSEHEAETVLGGSSLSATWNVGLRVVGL